MIAPNRSIRVWACPVPVDLRKGFNGLFGMVSESLGKDPLSGEYFLFVSRNRTTAKVLAWDGTGLCIYQKRLARGRFACLWGGPPGEPVRLTATELALFLEGSRLIGRMPVSPEEVRV